MRAHPIRRPARARAGVRLAGWLVVVLVLGAAPAARAANEPATPPGVRVETLKNGLRLLLAPDSTAGAVDVAVWYLAGPAYEKPGIRGISHLFEHTMFRGSKNVGPQEHHRRIQAEGGTANAFTNPDFTCYYETLPREALALAFQLEADRMASLRLTQDNLDAEKRVVREERRWRGENNPLGRALQSLYTLGYPSHPYGWPVMGTEDDLDRITLADCEAYFRTRYAPSNAVVTVVGQFDADEAAKLARQWFGAVPRRAGGGARPPRERAQTAPRRGRERGEGPLPLLAVGWRGPGDADPDAPALELLSRLVAGSPSARLQKELVGEKQSVLFLQSGFDGRRESTLFYVVAAARQGADSTAVERDVIEGVERYARTPVTDEELARARRQVEIGTLFGWQTSRGRAESIGTGFVVDGDAGYPWRELAKMRLLTPADVQRAAARVLTAAHRNVLWSLPGPAPPATAPAGGGR